MAKKKSACPICTKLPVADRDGVPLLSRVGVHACEVCAGSSCLAPLTIGIVGTLGGRPLIEVDGQCPWCPRGDRHLHLMKKAAARVTPAGNGKEYRLVME